MVILGSSFYHTYFISWPSLLGRIRGKLGFVHQPRSLLGRVSRSTGNER